MGKDTQGSSRLLFGNSILYAGADFLAKGLHFILLPIYTLFLTTEDYGIQTIILSFNSVLCYVVLLCIDSAILRFYSEYKDDEYSLRRFYGTAINIVCLFAMAVISICVFLQEFLLKYIFKGIAFYPCVMIGLILLVLDSIYTLHRRMLEAQQKGKVVAAVSFVSILFSSGLTILLIGKYKMGIFGVLTASLCTSIGMVCFALVDIARHRMWTFCVDIKIAKKLLSYSLPLIPHQMSGYLATLISKIFLNISDSLATVGLYSIATQFSSVVDVFQDSVSRAYRPWLFEKLKNKEQFQKQEIENISGILISLYTIIYLGLGLFSQELILLMTPRSYHDAWRVIPLLVMSMSFRSIYYFYLAQCLYYTQTSKKLFFASVTANLSNICAAAVLVPRYGMYGSAIASLISIIVNTIIVIVLNRRNGDIGYKFADLLKRIFVSWLFILIGIVPSYVFKIDELNVAVLTYKILVCCLYLLYLWFSNRKMIYAVSNTNTMRNAIKGFWKR